MRRLLLLALCVPALAGGCGGDGGGSEKSPDDRLKEAVNGFEEAVGEQDCVAFARYVHTTVRPPGRDTADPPDAAECRGLGEAYTQLSGFEAEKMKRFGSAAIVQGRVDGRFVALVWTLDVDGRWKQVQAMPPGTDPQIGGPPRLQTKFAQNAARWVDAMRAGDCRKAFRLLHPMSPYVGADGAAGFCKRFEASRRDPARLPAQLAQAPAAKPVDLGGTRDLHFFRLDTGRGRSWVVITATLPRAVPAPRGALDESVLDYYPISR